MNVVRIVPVRRLPNERSWFDYGVPESMLVVPGQLVRVPFARQTVNGIVWDILDHSSEPSLKMIESIVEADPLMTDWQRQTINQLAEWYLVSRATIIANTLPSIPRRAVRADEPIDNTWTPLKNIVTPSERVWWYRDRAAAMRQSLDWLLKDLAIRMICVPTVEDIDDYVSLLGNDSRQVHTVHSQMSDRDYRRLYRGILNNTITKVIGTGKVFLLPWTAPPHVLLDQEEHPAHHQTEQHPRFDNRDIFHLVRPQGVATTPAPSLATMHAKHPLPPAFQGRRRLASLAQPGGGQWLTPEAEDLIDDALHHGLVVRAIVPHRGFAQRLVCRECGWTLKCGTCQQRVRIDHFRGTKASCQFCRSTVVVPATCPQCHSARLALGGLGVEQFVETARRRWPTVSVTSDQDELPNQAGIHVGTYQSYRRRHGRVAAGPTIIVSGDALLSYPDFSVQERAWTYLSRLQAEEPLSEVLVQTYEPELTFWQRWRHGDDRSWYADELQQRKTLLLPPVAEQWIVYCPGATEAEINAKREEIIGLTSSSLVISVLPPLQRRRWTTSISRLLIQAPAGVPLRSATDWSRVFPTPWQLDPSIRGWSE